MFINFKKGKSTQKRTRIFGNFFEEVVDKEKASNYTKLVCAIMRTRNIHYINRR